MAGIQPTASVPLTLVEQAGLVDENEVSQLIVGMVLGTSETGDIMVGV
jgi:hypothetical protein